MKGLISESYVNKICFVFLKAVAGARGEGERHFFTFFSTLLLAMSQSFHFFLRLGEYIADGMMKLYLSFLRKRYFVHNL